MAKFQLHLRLAVLAVVFAATYGLSKRASGSILSAMLQGKDGRQRRDADGPACAEYFNCQMPNGREEFVTNVMQFNLGTAASQAQSQCGPENDVTCYTNGCTSHLVSLSFMTRIYTWACNHVDQLQNGISTTCWEEPFQTWMQLCTEQHLVESPADPAMEHLLECFALVPQDLPSCTGDNAQFVRALANEIAAAGREQWA